MKLMRYLSRAQVNIFHILHRFILIKSPGLLNDIYMIFVDSGIGMKKDYPVPGIFLAILLQQCNPVRARLTLGDLKNETDLTAANFETNTNKLDHFVIFYGSG